MLLLRLLIPLCLLGIADAAHASYVFQCRLEGQVVSAPKIRREYFLNDAGLEIEREISAFQFAVRQAQANGRADSSCEQTFAGKTIHVTLNAGYPAVKALRQGEQIRIQYFKKDFKGATATESFSLPLETGR